MARLEMYRGDHEEHTVEVPAHIYQVGSKVHFAVKEQLDDNEDDSAALFTVTMTDSDITSHDDDYYYYKLTIDKTKTNSYDFGLGVKKKKFFAEVQFVNASGQPKTFKPFEFLLKKETNRRTT